jgi:hypothetical protein
MDRHSQSSAGAAQNAFSARDFVDTVPFIPDDGGATTSGTPPDLEASSLFFNDLPEAAPTRAHQASAHTVESAAGARARRSPDDAVPPPSVNRGAPASRRPGDKTPAADTGSSVTRPAPIAVARSSAADHPRSAARSHTSLPAAASRPGRFPGRSAPVAPVVRRNFTPARASRRTMILAAVTAAVSVFLLVRAATRSDQVLPGGIAAIAAAAPEASTSHDVGPSHSGSATAARSMPDASSPSSLQAPAPIGYRASGRASDTSPAPREDRSGRRSSAMPSVQHRPDATREAVAASIATAQSKADAFLRSESPLPSKPSSGPGAP